PATAAATGRPPSATPSWRPRTPATASRLHSCRRKPMLPTAKPAAAPERSPMPRYRVSMDIGGTFTDVVAYDEERGTYTAGKASTTPRDLTEGVFAGLGQVIDSPASIGFTVHGTTVGLNAFLQRRGEKVLLLATEGAGDVYHIARGNRARLY